MTVRLKVVEMDVLSKEFYDACASELKDRVSEKRYTHVMGVSQTAEDLANRYGIDPDKARLAGLLHDWDKDLDDDAIRDRMVELGLQDKIDPWVVANMPRVLHGPTAAAALSSMFPELPQDVIDAIYKHTTASTDMSDLDKVIYIADAIEPSRRFGAVDELRADVDSLTLDELYLRIYKFWIMALIEHDVVLYPDTLDIWNDLAMKVKRGDIVSDWQRSKEERAAKSKKKDKKSKKHKDEKKPKKGKKAKKSKKN